MPEKKIEDAIVNLRQEVENLQPEEEHLQKQLGLRGESGTFGDSINAFVRALRETGSEGRERFMEEMVELEGAVRERYPRLADSIRAAITIIENAGL